MASRLDAAATATVAWLVRVGPVIPDPLVAVGNVVQPVLVVDVRGVRRQDLTDLGGPADGGQAGGRGLFSAAGVPFATVEAGLSPSSLVAMTLTAYSTPPVRPVMVWVVPVTVAWETSAAVSQLSAASFHCTL